MSLTDYNKQNGKGMMRLFKALRCSLQGLSFAWRYESAFRQEIVLVACLFPTTFFLAESIPHWSLLVAVLFLVLLVELFNSAIETLADRITLAHDPMIGRAKDIGSAAVVITLCLVAVLWGAAILARIGLI